MPSNILLDIYLKLSYLAIVHGTPHKIKVIIMATPASSPMFVSHFTCQACSLSFKSYRKHFLTRELCPLCKRTNYAHTWSFTARNLAQVTLPTAIKDLAEDVAYAVYTDQALFTEPTRSFMVYFEVDDGMWPYSAEGWLTKSKQEANHD